MTVVTLHRAPTCFVCHELPAEYLMHAAPTPPADPAERAPVHALPAVVMPVCASCARPYLDWPALPAGLQLCRLGAGILAALAGAQPRCSVVTCSAAVSKWGRRCEPCAARGEAAVEAELAVAAERRKTAKALRRRARAASKRPANPRAEESTR